jgi:ABC-type cobalamin transport system permease subunit
MEKTMKKKSKEETARFVGALLLVLFLIALVTTISVTQGAIHVSPDEIVKIVLNRASGKELFVVTWEQKTENIIWNIRFPRVIMAFIVGAGLSLCGVLMQALTGIIFQKCNNGGFHLCKAILFTDALDAFIMEFADAPHGLQIFGCLKHRRILLSANSSKSKSSKTNYL